MRKIITPIYFLAISIQVFAQEPTDFTVSYYEDVSGVLKIDHIDSVHFTKSESNNVLLGYVRHPVWLKVTLQKQFPDLSILSIKYPILDSIALYYSTPSGWHRKLYGDAVEKDERLLKERNINFFLPQGSIHQILYLRIVTESSMRIPIEIATFEDTLRNVTIDQYIYGFLYGGLIIMFLYNLAIFIFLKNISYLYYCAHIFFYVLFLICIKGHLYQLIPFQLYHTIINETTLNTANLRAISIILFTFSFLKVERSSKKSYYFLWGNLLFSVTISLLDLFFPYVILVNIAIIQHILLYLGLTIVGWHSYSKGHRYARYYVLGWTFVFFSFILVHLRSLGFLDEYFFFDYINNYGVLLECILLSFALADRFNYYKSEQAKTKSQALALAKENERLIRTQNQRLEEEVRIRTDELVEKHYEIEAQSEEINAQNEELSAQRNQLEEFTLMLGEKVQAQTGELQKNNKVLAMQNRSLQQFAYVVAHNIRAPIARLLGLTKLYDLEPDNKNQQKIINMIKNSSVELDEVVSEVNDILELNKNADNTIATVSVSRKIALICGMLEKEIQNYKVSIRKNIALEQVRTTDSYLESILYNLISNAIKFSKDDDHSQVTISNYEKEAKVYFEVSDNGLGMDLSKVKNKIFQLYQRFEASKSGKGIGLYIVKSQVEAIGGEIECESEVGKGTTFTFWFPKK